MKNADHLTKGHDEVLARQIAISKPGMAHWAATGPLSATCKQCTHYGYWQQRNAYGDELERPKRRTACCEKFFKLTGKHGNSIPPDTEACRHFEY